MPVDEALAGVGGTVEPQALAPGNAAALFGGLELHVQGEAGILGNALNPSQGTNGQGYTFGQFYTDHANQAQLNQLLVTILRPLETKAAGFAFGYTVEGIFGSDERFNHVLGIGDQFMGSKRNQLNLLQAFAAIHAPVVADGLDLKIGLFTSPQGIETLDAATTPLYSHSYTYNYSVTINHTGVFSTTHVARSLDIYLGTDAGNQASVGFPGGHPNGQFGGFVGFGLNEPIDGLTIVALSHIGPEQSFGTDPLGASRDLRYYNDVSATYRMTEFLTTSVELNYTRDAFGIGNGKAEALSVVSYVGYTFGGKYTLNLRAEAYRDAQNFFVTTPQDNSGITRAELGYPLVPPTLVAPNGLQGTTYGAVTLGLSIRPDVVKPFALVVLRPEVRFDEVLAGGRAFNSNAYLGGASGSRSQFTFGGDVIIGF